MPHRHKKRVKKPAENAACINCQHAIYIGEGDSICDMRIGAIVLEEFNSPAEDYMCCSGKDFEENN